MTQKIDIYNLEGKVTGQVELPAAIFDVTVNDELLAQAVRVLEARNRQATSKVKSRGEVSRTGHKAWKQKGTGRARHGSRNAPIFVGGGVAHGPSGDQNYDLRFPKKMKQLALKGALSQAVKDGQISIVDGLAELKPSTKELVRVLKNLKSDSVATVVMLEAPVKSVVQAGKNIEKVTITQAKRINVYEILKADKIIIHKPALDTLVATYTKAAPPAPVVKKAKKGE